MNVVGPVSNVGAIAPIITPGGSSGFNQSAAPFQRQPYGLHAPAQAGPQFRYIATRQDIHAGATSNQRRSAAIRRTGILQAVTSAAVKRRLGLPVDSPDQNTQPQARALGHYFDSCESDDLAYERSALVSAWSAIRQITPESAAMQLTLVDSTLRDIFFDLSPAHRRAPWDALGVALRTDVNLLIRAFDAVHVASFAQEGAHSSSYKVDNTPMCDALAKALNGRPDTEFPTSTSPYRIALRNVLRELDAANPTFFQDRIAVFPSNVAEYVNLLPPPPAQRTLPGLTDPAYLDQRKEDLAALRYTRIENEDCRTTQGPVSVLASIRTRYRAAIAAEKRDAAIMDGMFQSTGASNLISHNGISFHNAAGKDVDGLVTYLDGLADPAFLQLDAAQKKRLVRIRLHRMEESPDYVIGTVEHTMATILQRISDLPESKRYVRYLHKFHLLECWEKRYKQWVERRDFEMSPQLYSAMHSAGSNGVYYCNLSWYRGFWNKRILGPINNSTTVRDASAEDRAALWQWVAARSPGWSAGSHRWHAVTPESYANAVTGMMEAFYDIQKAVDLPRFEILDSYGAGHTLYHTSLSGLSFPIRQAITDIAKNFKSPLFSTEVILSDDWMTTSYRMLENAQYRTALVMQEPPSYSVEVAAYVALLNHGLSHAQMTSRNTRVFCSISDNAYQQRLRPAHDAFISVLRNAHSNDLLLLPNGKTIYPHAITNDGFRRYCDGLVKNAWVIGRARQNLRDRGIPLLPGLLKAEIESVAAPFRKKASKATASGTELADYFFGALPISSPILQLSRAVRAGNYAHTPYYLLILARDIMAVAAMRGALGAAYLKPLQVASRYGSASLLSTSALGAKRFPNDGRSGMRNANVNREKAQDISFSGDQAHSIQSKVIRRSNQNSAANHYVASPIQRGTSDFKSQGFGPDDWENMMQVLLPLNVMEADRQRQKVRSIVTKNENALLNITVIEEADETGTKAGMLGLSQINANTLCDGKLMYQRLTVLEAQDWRLKTEDALPQSAEKLIRSHITVNPDQTAVQAWEDRPSLHYDPIALLINLYDTSPQFFKTLHWYDDHAIESHTISIRISNECTEAKVTHSPVWTAVDIELPANPERLPYIANELQMARQTILEAILESFMHAITRVPPPTDALHERGVNVWLTNQILLESGQVFIPRINAALFNVQAPWQYQNISNIAEQEDQYLERIVTDYQLPPAHGKFQGEDIAQRPTVVDTVAVLSRLAYPAHVQGKQAAITTNTTLAEFRHRVEQKFEIDQKGCDSATLEMIDLFLYECYIGSSLFQKLFDENEANPLQRWKIYPNGFYAMGALRQDKLMPLDRTIDAGTERAVYLGLAQTEAESNAQTNMDTALSTAAPQVQPIESMRRLMDGLVTAMSGLDGNGTVSPLEFDPIRHRGAVVWISDIIFWQAGWMANKRLARIVLPDWPPGVDDIAHLTGMAGANRRAARAEDAYLMAWLYTAP